MAREAIGGRLAALLFAGVASSIMASPPAMSDSFSPVAGGRSASATIEDLQAEGYDVRINWTTGFDTKPLTECWVTGVNNPSHEAPTEGVFTTIYVDVACPNGDDGPSFGVGVGIG